MADTMYASYTLYAADVKAAKALAKGAGVDVVVRQSSEFGGFPEGEGAFVMACSPRQNEILSVYRSFGLPAFRVRDSLPELGEKAPKKGRK